MPTARGDERKGAGVLGESAAPIRKSPRSLRDLAEKRALSARRLFLWMVGVLTRLYLAFFFFFFVRAVRLTATEIATVRVSSLPGDHS